MKPVPTTRIPPELFSLARTVNYETRIYKPMRKSVLCLLVSIIAVSLAGCTQETEEPAPIGMAVEFMDHAACAYISRDKGWYEDEGLEMAAYESYATGMALAAALARGDIQAAYICLIPAINAYANAKVPIKIVAGTHKYGYGLVVNTEKIASVKDLENTGLRIGCVKEGGAADVVFHRAIDKYGLDKEKVMANIQRMNPQKLALAMKMGKLDAACMPEHWATVAEGFGYEMLIMSQDVWPDMQGSVLAVKEDLLKENPETVEKLVKVSQKATDWIHDNPQDSAEILSRRLNEVGDNTFPAEIADMVNELDGNQDVMLRSMERLDFTTGIDVREIQATIDYVAGLGYIAESFDAGEILDLRFIDR